MIQAFSSHRDIYGKIMKDKISVTVSITGTKADIIDEFLEIYDHIHDNYNDVGLYIDTRLVERITR